jgi:hypothetical protein
MFDQLDKLQVDLVGYRKAVDQIFSPALTTPKDWRECFLGILICTSQLYVDYLLVMKNLPVMGGMSKSGSSDQLRADMARERDLRKRLKDELESSPCWSHFLPENPFAGLTGLHTRQDYVDRFTLHLPEIYEETFRVEAYTKNFMGNHSAAALARISVALQHLGRNHIIFVLQPLEFASDEDSWNESLVRATP